MSEKLIKSVRVRPRYDNESYDLKISLFEDGKSRILKCFGFRAWSQVVYKTNDYSGYTNDDFIFQYIEDNKNSENRQLVDITYNQHLGTSINKTDAKYRKKYGAYNPPFYEIVEDPYLEGTGPKKRSFGFDPYYLNNGAKIQIKWLNGLDVVGGDKFSDNFGRESDPYSIGQLGLDEKYNFIKSVSVYPPSSATGSVTFTIADDEGFMYISDDTRTNKEWNGTKTDDDILSEILTKWKAVYQKKDIGICENSLVSCPITTQYIDPVSSTRTNSGTASGTASITGTASFTGTASTSTTGTASITGTASGTASVPKISGIYTFDVTKPGYLVNKELGELEIISKEEADLADVDQFVFQSDVSDQISDEYKEVTFSGLEEVYIGPDPNAVDDTWDSVDLERGLIEESNLTFTDYSSSSSGGSVDLPVARPETNSQKELVKYACKSTGSGGPGKCDSYTFNHANNYTRAIIKKDAQGVNNAAGGNANQEGYHSNLERLGYKRKDLGTLTKANLKSTLEDKSKWNIGDVVAYWGVAKYSSSASKSGVKYGHTQMFTNGNHGGSNAWTSDQRENFSCSFVYNGYSVENWRLIAFIAPTP